MLCILCATASEKIIHIFEEEGLSLNVCKIITKHFWLQPSAEDCNTKVICYRCWDALNSFHKFYQEVTEAHAKVINVKPLIEDDASDTNHYATYTDFFSEDVKLEASDNSKADLADFVEDKLMAHPDSIDNSAKTTQAVKPDSNSDIKLNKRADSTKKDASDSDNDSDSSTNMEPKLSDDSDYKPNISKAKKRIVSTDHTFESKKISCKEFDSFIKKNMKLSCEVCHVPLATFFILKDHYRSAHNEVGYVNCCDKKFDSRHALVQHILLHQNPEFFKCEKCGRVLNHRKGLNSHMKRHEREEHIHKCNKCGRSFAKRGALERHINAHEKPHLICEHCGLVTRDKGFLRRHQLWEHSSLPRERVQCKKCGVYLYSASLSGHMKHQHPETKVTHVCNICGKISATEDGLRKHVRYMHQNERRHKCSMCEKAFKAAWKLRVSGIN